MLQNGVGWMTSVSIVGLAGMGAAPALPVAPEIVPAAVAPAIVPVAPAAVAPAIMPIAPAAIAPAGMPVGPYPGSVAPPRLLDVGIARLQPRLFRRDLGNSRANCLQPFGDARPCAVRGPGRRTGLPRHRGERAGHTKCTQRQQHAECLEHALGRDHLRCPPMVARWLPDG